MIINIARIANTVQCHNWLSDNKDCHGFRFSIVRIVISVSNVTSPSFVFVIVLLSIIVTIVINVIIFIIVNNHKNCQKCLKLSKIVKLVRACFLITLIKYLQSHRSEGWKLKKKIENKFVSPSDPRKSENQNVVQKSKHYLKKLTIWQFSENLKIFWKSENFPKIWNFKKIVRKCQNCQKMSQMSCSN